MTFAGQKLLKKDDTDGTEEVDAGSVIDGAEVVAIYFSAHWCPPCRNFTPLLKTFWEANKKKGLVIIFVSSDRTPAEAEDYFKKDHGNYYMMPHGSDLGATLKKNCEVSGIPCLCVVDKEGQLKYKEGRADVTNNPEALAKWKAL